MSKKNNSLSTRFCGLLLAFLMSIAISHGTDQLISLKVIPVRQIVKDGEPIVLQVIATNESDEELNLEYYYPLVPIFSIRVIEGSGTQKNAADFMSGNPPKIKLKSKGIFETKICANRYIELNAPGRFKLEYKCNLRFTKARLPTLYSIIATGTIEGERIGEKLNTSEYLDELFSHKINANSLEKEHVLEIASYVNDSSILERIEHDLGNFKHFEYGLEDALVKYRTNPGAANLIKEIFSSDACHEYSVATCGSMFDILKDHKLLTAEFVSSQLRGACCYPMLRYLLTNGDKSIIPKRVVVDIFRQNAPGSARREAAQGCLNLIGATGDE